MDYQYTKEQKMYQDSARTFFNKEWTFDLLRDVLNKKGYSEKLWKKVVDLGWVAMLIDEKYNGVGGNLLDLCPIFEEIGKSLFPSPLFISSIAGVSILSGYGTDTMKNKILPVLADGNLILTLACVETANGWSENQINMTAEKTDAGYILSGVKFFVPFADSSDYLICCAKETTDNRTSLFLVDTKAKGIDLTSMKTFSTEWYNKVIFDKVIVPEENLIGQNGSGWDIIETLMPLFAVSRCMEMVGGIQKTLDITLKYIKERVQFGVPIGKFQALQHRCAEMAIDVETSRYITYQAVWRLSENLSCRREASIAKSWTGDAYQRVTAQAHQLHGAMGFTDECNLHFYYKHAKALQLTYGGGSYHRKVVAQEFGY